VAYPMGTWGPFPAVKTNINMSLQCKSLARDVSLTASCKTRQIPSAAQKGVGGVEYLSDFFTSHTNAAAGEPKVRF
jgi:hypothetical protein